MTDKIVRKPIKIDLHIHSKYSSIKDGNLVKDNTEENILVLVDGLKKNNIDMCSITDHDSFSYSMYSALKQYEYSGDIKKVLPGVEFSVLFNDSKVIHIVTIFNDSDIESLKKMDEIINGEIGASLYDKKKQAFEKDNYFELLRKIGIDFIMIAHQKKTPTSMQKAKKMDVMSLGRDVFNELLFMDYFDAYEFRNKDNEVFNKKYAIDNDVKENLRFITGSDCHVWEKYPNTKDEDKEIKFTYIDALPTFKGLVMAVTDYHRINYTGNFWGQGHYLETLNLSIFGVKHTIPMSKGINVIIGDNSIGKSLLLHDIVDDIEDLDTKQKKGYKKYKEKNNLVVCNHLKQTDVFKFNSQGNIRAIFEDSNFDSDKYLEEFFPDDIDVKKYKKRVDSEFERLFNAIDRKFKRDQKINELSPLNIIVDYPEDGELSIGTTIEHNNTTKINNLVISLGNVISELKNNILSSSVIEKDDREMIDSEIQYLELVKEKYDRKLNSIKKENEKINIFNTALKQFKDDYYARQTDVQNQFNAFVESKNNLINDIVSLVKEDKGDENYAISVEEIDVVPEENHVDKYIFVSKIGIERINNDYIQGTIKSVLKKNKNLNISTLTPDLLRDMIARFPNDIEDALEGFKNRINNQIDKDFSIKRSIVENGNDIYEDLSDGFNSRIYFRLLSGEERNSGIYIVDQPEDHISQKAIKEEVLDLFRRMRKKRQIIMVTHNPQFIVNLDVDNVIYLDKNDGIIRVRSGALEYENDDYSILNIVAENIDGGLATIKQRMKIYEKNI